jgi:methionyl-tRNA formyltransferase
VKVLFWGTPEFATASLRALIGEGFDVIGVVTQPDKSIGRSRSKSHASAVKQVAVTEGIPVLQPEKPRGEEFMAQLEALAPDVSVVVAYGHILPTAVIDLPRLGTLNIHASLLPELRGAAPIQAAIREGLAETGVSIMQMEAGLDSGPVYHQAAVTIGAEETGGELTHRLAQIGAAALIETVTSFNKGAVRPVPQDNSLATHAPKIGRSHCHITWSEGADSCARRIRAFDPEPGAWTTLEGQEIKLFSARIHQHLELASSDNGKDPGTVLRSGDRLSISTGHGTLIVREVQPSGKRRMPVADWVRGRPVPVGQRFE